MSREKVEELLHAPAKGSKAPDIIGYVRPVAGDATRVAIAPWRGTSHADDCVLLVSEIADVVPLGGNKLAAVYLIDLQATVRRLEGRGELHAAPPPPPRPPTDPDGSFCHNHIYYQVWIGPQASQNYVEAVGCC